MNSRPNKLGTTLSILALMFGFSAFASDSTRRQGCHFEALRSELVSGKSGREAGVAYVQHYYDILDNPEKALGVKLKNLSQELSLELTTSEIRQLSSAFHEALMSATADGKNAFALDNLKHVSLHYRDIEKHRQAIEEFFGRPGERHAADIALLVASAHDIGKIAQLSGHLSPEVNALYDEAVKNSPEGAKFFQKTILGHDGLSMDGISHLVSRFAKAKSNEGDTAWTPAKARRVTRLLQAAIARHNAGYARLENNKELGTFHFWQTEYPKIAALLRGVGVNVSDTYPAAVGGWVPSLLAMIDRGTALHPSFVEKVAGQGNFAWTPESVAGLLKANARSVREEVDSIATELGRYVNPGKRIEDFPLLRQYREMADQAEALGKSILSMNSPKPAMAGRPTLKPADHQGFVYYAKPNGQWYRVGNGGLLQKHLNGMGSPWVIEPLDTSLSSAQILMNRLIGYSPIFTDVPKVGGPMFIGQY